MLPPKVVNLLGGVANFGWRCGFTPYKWDKEIEKFVFDKKPRLWYRLLCQLVVLVSVQLFLMVRCIQTLQNEQSSLFWKIRVVYMASSRLLMHFDHQLTLSHYGEYQHIVFNFIQVTKDFSALTGGSESSMQDGENGAGLTRNMMLFVFARFFAAVTDGLLPLKKPESPLHLTSLFKEPTKLPMWQRGLISVLHLYVNAFHYYIGVLYASTVCAHVAAVLPMVKKLKCSTIHVLSSKMGISRRPETHQGLGSRWMTTMEFFKRYNQLAVLQKQVNFTFGFWMLGFEVTHLVVVILNLFQAVVLGDLRGLILVIIVGFLFLYLITHLAQLYEVSYRILDTWRFQRDPIWFSRWFKGSQPLKMNVGNFYYADNPLVLTIVGIIIQNSVTLIVTYKVD